MFFDANRITAVRQMILAEALEARQAALAKLLPMQRSDFEEIFTAMAGLPVTIRLLDPPLHEFLPHKEEEIEEVARVAGTDPKKLRARAIALHESNPMLGHRGCRLGITYPEIYEMQARAILEAALAVEERGGAPVELEIMIPLVGFKTELDFLSGAYRRRCGGDQTGTRKSAAIPDRHHDRTAARGVACCGDRGDRAVLLIRHQRSHPDHHQASLRDDAGMFLNDYMNQGIIARDPFVTRSTSMGSANW